LNVRWVAKRLLEKGLRLTLGWRNRVKSGHLILAYHNVVPDELAGRGDRSLHLPVTRFLRQLDLLQSHCRVAPLAEILAGAASEQRPTVAITFDDAYRGATELALPELARRALPTTMFVAPGLFGSRSFWWDEMASGRVGLAPEVRKSVLERGRALNQDGSTSMPVNPGREDLPECYACADEGQVRDISDLATVTLGAHSWSHASLPRLDPDELTVELSRPLEWLGSWHGATLPILAYPYGLRSAAVETAAARAGYSAALLIDGGWYTTEASRWAIPRYNVPAGLSEDGLWLRLAGVIEP
jgi:peptidoglycan/xylan/chitin deacetylase (PgdA/CDA1 family)